MKLQFLTQEFSLKISSFKVFSGESDLNIVTEAVKKTTNKISKTTNTPQKYISFDFISNEAMVSCR